jgi:hypothetical protein
MEIYLGRSLETFGSKLETDAILAKQFQENPLEALRSEGIPVAQYYALDHNAVAQAASGTELATHADDDAVAAVHPPSEFVSGFLGAYFYVTSEEARALTVSRALQLIREAYDRLSPEQKEWIGPKLHGLEIGMVAGILVWVTVGQTCGAQRVMTFSAWPRQNFVWTLPVCA